MDLKALVDAQDARSVHVVGWCNGAQVALRFASTWPACVRSVVLLCPALPVPQGYTASDYEVFLREITFGASRDRRTAELLSEVLRRKAAPSEGLTGCADGRAHLRRLARLPYRSGESLFRYGFTSQRFAVDQATDMDLPPNVAVLLVTGGRDTIVHPARSRMIAARLPQAEVLHLSHADHDALYHESEVGERVLEFLLRFESVRADRA
jgi:pimeloyl-ACP methyl ester carboxylesterase